MYKFRRILVALDLGPRGDAVTPGSLNALQRAAWVASRVNASLTLLYSDESGGEPGAAAAAEKREQGLRRALEATPFQLPPDLEVRVVARSEPAGLAIIREVLRDGIDCVLAGERTAVYDDGRRIGTVARQLQRECPCPVWLEDPRSTSDPSLILAGTDLTPVGDRAVELAASVAHALGAELHVVHAFALSMEAQVERLEPRQAYEARMRASAEAQILAVLAETPMADTAKLHIGCTSPTHAIEEGAERLKPGLIVMGTVSRGGIAGMLMGNTAEKLVDRLDCSLLTIKPVDFVCPVSLDADE